MHLNSQILFLKYAAPYFKPGMKILEIGPDGHPSTYKKAISDRLVFWETIDVFFSEELTYTAKSEYEFPCIDNTFDIVLSGQVIEHVRKTWVWIKELARVCKVGGKIITIAPTSWPYHEAPIDCWRIFPEGMKALYEEADLRVDLCEFESLEPSHQKNILPGSGALIIGKEKSCGIKRFIKKIVKRPVTVSFDTIAIGTKLKS